jgi:CIC family chloride channel protein
MIVASDQLPYQNDSMDVKELAKGTFTSNKDTNVLATLDTSSITNRLFNSTGLGELDLNSVDLLSMPLWIKTSV